MSRSFKINLRAHTDFSELFSIVFRFVRNNFQPLLALLIFALSPIILLSAFTGYLLDLYLFEGHGSIWLVFSNDDFSQKLSDGLSENFLLVISFMVLHIFLFALSRAAMSVYIKRYVNSDHSHATGLKDQVKESYKKAFQILPVLFLFILCFSIPAVLLLLFLKYVVMVYSELLLSVFIFLMVMALPIVIPFTVFVFFHQFFFLKIRDAFSVVKTTRKLFEITKGNLISIWVYCVCMLGIVFILNRMLEIPISIYQVFFSFSRSGQIENDFSITALIILFLSRFFFFLIYCLMDILAAATFYSFEEQKQALPYKKKSTRSVHRNHLNPKGVKIKYTVLLFFLLSVMVLPSTAQTGSFTVFGSSMVQPIFLDSALEAEVFTDEDYDYLQKSRPPGKNFIREFWEWLTQSGKNKKQKDPGKVQTGTTDGFWNSDGFASLLLMFLVLALLFSCIYFIRTGQLKKLLSGKPMSGSPDFSDLQEDIHVIPIEDYIVSAIQNKNYRLAVRWSYIRILKKLSLQSLIEFKPHKTNYDYQLELKSTSLHSGFIHSSRVYEFVWYGELNIEERDFQSFAASLKNFEREIDV